MSLSRCQLFEAGFHLGALHLRDESCKGTLQDGRLFFHFNNDDQLCGTVLRVQSITCMILRSILTSGKIEQLLKVSCIFRLKEQRDPFHLWEHCYGRRGSSWGPHQSWEEHPPALLLWIPSGPSVVYGCGNQPSGEVITTIPFNFYVHCIVFLECA